MDFDVSIFIITSDKQYIPVSEYDDRLDEEGVFVMLTNDELNTEFGDDNSICIYKEWINALKRTRDELKSCIEFEKTDRRVACPWQIEQESIPNTFKLNDDTDNIGDYNTFERNDCVSKYLDGHRTNQEVIKNAATLLKDKSIEEYLPAIMLAYHTQVTFDDRNIHGYLPAIGQLICMSDNSIIINDSLEKNRFTSHDIE